MENKDVYFVAVKVFLVDDAGRFLIVKDRFGDWDIPGGRLKENEFSISLSAVIERKVKEELGEMVRYEVGDPVVFMRHERDEILSDGKKEKRRIFAVGYLATYTGGEVKMGKNHEKFEWVSIDAFRPEDYFTGGWLKGIQEFQAKYRKK
ncbi:MAG: NUDIX hydrolase [Candidatus Staskawiczbacteria bacterium]|nr:NUDIX hydrolase [Candidatus Staskawiczbacteria bacterium]